MRVKELSRPAWRQTRRGARRCASSAISTRPAEYCRRQDEEKENEMQRALLFQDFMQDLRIGIRSLLRAPVLTLTIIVTVGLGLGATAAIFSAVSAALLRPLPYARAGESRSHLHRRAAVQVPLLGRGLSRVHRTADAVRAARDLYRSRSELQQRQHRRTAAHSRGVVGILLGARHPADDRPRLQRSGRQAGDAASGHRRPYLLAASGWAAAPTRSASPSASMAPTTR